MTREEIQKDADNFDLPIERDIYELIADFAELIADFAELLIKKREKEIVDELKTEGRAREDQQPHNSSRKSKGGDGMTREEMMTEAIRWKDGRIDFLIMEKGVNPYHLLADFALAQIKKREKEIVDKIKEFKDDLACTCDSCWRDGSLLDEAIQIVRGE